MSELYDAVVIGGGPAGASAATLLAREGHRVVVLEKTTFPRYSIGESLIPHCYFPLKRLGLIDKLKQSAFPKKYSVQFVGRSGSVSQPFYFFQHREHESSQSWQVLRSDFDTMLLDNARDHGAEVVYATTAAKFLTGEHGQIAGVEDSEGRKWHAKMTLDASGRNGFATTRLGWRIRDRVLNKVAVWRYYKGAKRDAGLDEGATTVAYLPETGWFWYIPLPDDTVSVGIVAERDYLFSETKDLEAIFEREIENNAWIKEHLSCGTQSEAARVTGEFTYRSEFCAKDGLVLIGDAFTFLDPVFSSGVFLALKSGELAADAVHQAIVDDDFSASRFKDYSETLCGGVENMRKLVYAFYDEKFRFSSLLEKHPDLRGDLTDCLIGDLFKDFGPLFAALAEFADPPEPLRHGRPQIAEGKAKGKVVAG